MEKERRWKLKRKVDGVKDTMSDQGLNVQEDARCAWDTVNLSDVIYKLLPSQLL